MKCLALTKKFKKCRREAKILFCHQHKIQRNISFSGIVAVIGFIILCIVDIPDAIDRLRNDTIVLSLCDESNNRIFENEIDIVNEGTGKRIRFDKNGSSKVNHKDVWIKSSTVTTLRLDAPEFKDYVFLRPYKGKLYEVSEDVEHLPIRVTRKGSKAAMSDQIAEIKLRSTINNLPAIEIDEQSITFPDSLTFLVNELSQRFGIPKSESQSIIRDWKPNHFENDHLFRNPVSEIAQDIDQRNYDSARARVTKVSFLDFDINHSELEGDLFARAGQFKESINSYAKALKSQSISDSEKGRLLLKTSLSQMELSTDPTYKSPLDALYSSELNASTSISLLEGTPHWQHALDTHAKLCVIICERTQSKNAIEFSNKAIDSATKSLNSLSEGQKNEQVIHKVLLASAILSAARITRDDSTYDTALKLCDIDVKTESELPNSTLRRLLKARGQILWTKFDRTGRNDFNLIKASIVNFNLAIETAKAEENQEMAIYYSSLLATAMMSQASNHRLNIEEKKEILFAAASMLESILSSSFTHEKASAHHGLGKIHFRIFVLSKPSNQYDLLDTATDHFQSALETFKFNYSPKRWIGSMDHLCRCTRTLLEHGESRPILVERIYHEIASTHPTLRNPTGSIGVAIGRLALETEEHSHLNLAAMILEENIQNFSSNSDVQETLAKIYKKKFLVDSVASLTKRQDLLKILVNDQPDAYKSELQNVELILKILKVESEQEHSHDSPGIKAQSTIEASPQDLLNSLLKQNAKEVEGILKNPQIFNLYPKTPQKE